MAVSAIAGTLLAPVRAAGAASIDSTCSIGIGRE